MRRIALVSLLALGIGFAVAPAGASGKPPCGLAGSFRIYSNALVYDAGGRGVPSPGFQQMMLTGSGWQFGKSKGTFTTAAITAADWKRWKATPYGPTQKIVLSGWNHGTADGPLETEPNAVDFFWVIYHVTSPAGGTMELKFGHLVVPKSCP